MSTSEGAVEARLNRTCEGCRKRKIRCIPDPSDSRSLSEKCNRCRKLDIDCVFNAPATRKRRRRNETRIHELEQKLEEVQRAVATERQKDLCIPPISEASITPASTHDSFLSSGRFSDTSPGTSSLRDTTDELSAKGDPVSRGIVEESLAEELCIKFCTELLPHYPLVLPDALLSWRALQQDRPALFRAILATASSSFRPNLWTPLFRDAERYVMEQAMIYGRKSIDLIQAALVLVTWSHPPDKFQDLNFGQFVNVAATMVIDLRSSNDERYQVPPADPDVLRTKEYLEIARTFSACYFLCSSIAMSFRRQSNLRYGPWVEGCIDVLDPPAISHIGDQRLAAWVRLQRLAEESFAMVGVGSDESSSKVNHSDPRTRLILRGGLERVKDWRRNVPEDVMTLTLDIHYHVILLNFCEPGLYDNHELRDFRPPYAIHTLLSANQFAPDTPQYVDARLECLDVARNLIELFLQLSPEMLQQVPIIIFTRMMYAVVIITKLEVFKRPSADVSYMAEAEPISALDLMVVIIDKLRLASDGGRFLSPTTFHAVLGRLHSRCVESYWRLDMDQNEIIKPLMNLQVQDSSKEKETTPPEVHRERPMPEQQVFRVEHLSQHIEAGAFPDPSLSLDDYFPSAPANAGVEVFWSSFFSEGFLPTGTEQEFGTGAMDHQ
ncbi:hypothetical protein FSARC_9537 [Fusarium sarcochroum]|uniref:Zn(2)-C6 fungal-type domain-containing protein n=1 Tax=Fusarium sarcochroum TaxID=1208366 RepID=A0A8H4X651_9HYPO|nr:hypothetical protein FSARC_9537 [Fusarium sarcochroum]